MHNETVQNRMKTFFSVFEEKGVKVTNQRIEIFSEVARAEDHPDAETVHHRVKKRLPAVSLDTVYRSLWLFEELGLIKRLGMSQDRTRFDAHLGQHHHFVCLRCGLTRDVEFDTSADLNLPDIAGEMGVIGEVYVEVRGVCRQCIDREP